MLGRIFRKKRTPLTREQSLNTVPVRSRGIEESRDKDGNVVIFMPRRDVWWLNALAKVFFVPKGRKVALDELGTTVWEWIDDETNAEELINKFAAHFKLSKREAELSMVAYLRNLAKRGMIGLAIVKNSKRTGRKGSGRKNKSRK